LLGAVGSGEYQLRRWQHQELMLQQDFSSISISSNCTGTFKKHLL
jgi:hypothetical protein